MSKNVILMIGTHGNFGKELIKSAEMIIGDMKNVIFCPLESTMSLKDYIGSVENKLINYNTNIIAMTDILGGTPSNTFLLLGKKYKFPVLTGINLPMLIDIYLKVNSTNNKEFDNIEIEELLLDSIDTTIGGIKIINQDFYKDTNSEL